ncbi:MAG: hypothetical protein IAF08_09120 [Rhizobacter sp.]|nr:hypothetical protein [Chlorobiales bacterium]
MDLRTEHFLLIDGRGHIRGVYKGTLALETEKLIADIHTLKTETATRAAQKN